MTQKRYKSSKRSHSRRGRKSRRVTRSKSKVRIPIRRGTLSKYGYKSSKLAKVRRSSLKKAVKHEGYLPVFRKLIALSTLQKNRNPLLSKKFRSDARYVKSHFR
jgi:hypothetical protein